jgi:sulfoxide reductase heme-binding subunit YedZ
MPAKVPLVRWLNASWFAWLVLALPGVVLTYRYFSGATFYGEYLHTTGELGVWLLMLALAVTPLTLVFPKARWVAWLARRRRYLGVAAFGYSLLHAVAYLERQTAFTRILEEALELGLATGWIAFVVMLALAVTSNDASVRALRARWKTLHRAVYAAAALTFAHWILTAFDPTAAYVYLGILVALEVVRLLLTYLRARPAHHPSSTPPSNQSHSR